MNPISANDTTLEEMLQTGQSMNHTGLIFSQKTLAAGLEDIFALDELHQYTFAHPYRTNP
jgi:hypothetical protein